MNTEINGNQLEVINVHVPQLAKNITHLIIHDYLKSAYFPNGIYKGKGRTKEYTVEALLKETDLYFDIEKLIQKTKWPEGENLNKVTNQFFLYEYKSKKSMSIKERFFALFKS